MVGQQELAVLQPAFAAHRADDDRSSAAPVCTGPDHAEHVAAVDLGSARRSTAGDPGWASAMAAEPAAAAAETRFGSYCLSTWPVAGHETVGQKQTSKVWLVRH